ncbi:MAG TPA: hypothetical protein VGS06_40925 [Streptosporangiaceae bacterium]|nr:hypothetical protein [Streptosporangiaceae bacterium]
MPPTPAIAPKQPTRTGWALLLTSVAFFMVTLDSLVVVTALPAIHRELGGRSPPWSGRSTPAEA